MKKMNRWLRHGLIIVAVMSLTACAIQHSNDKSTQAAVKKAQTIYDKNQVVAPKSLVTTSDQVFLTNAHFVITPKQTLPSVFNQRLVYSTGVSETLAQTFTNISKLTHVPIVFADDKYTKTAIMEKNTSGVSIFQGSLQQVISQLVNHSGLYWTYKNGKIYIFLLETKTYALDAPIGAFDTDSTISSTSETSNSSSGGSGSSTPTVGGNSAMNLKYTIKADSPWSAALTTLKDMLSPSGKMEGNPVEGYVAITDNPDVQAKVADYIQKINEKTNKKIAVRIDVYDVITSDSSAYGLDINAVASILSSDQAAFVSHPSKQFSAENGEVSTLTFSSGQHNVVLNALNTLGKTTQVTGATIYTVSGQPAPIQSVREQTYLASQATTTTQESTQTSLVPGTVVYGYSMMVTPKIEANNQIMVTLNLQLSSLLGIDKISSTSDDSANSSIIEAPRLSNKNFLENMVLHNGQSLLIAGFQDETASSDTTSPTSPDFWLAGGGKTTAKAKTTTVIVVTPYIIGD